METLAGVLLRRSSLSLPRTMESLRLADQAAERIGFLADDVMVEHLLAHRSEIGDYLDEYTFGASPITRCRCRVHKLATTEQYLTVLDGHQTVLPAGERFAFNNARMWCSHYSPNARAAWTSTS